MNVLELWSYKSKVTENLYKLRTIHQTHIVRNHDQRGQEMFLSLISTTIIIIIIFLGLQLMLLQKSIIMRFNFKT